MRRDRIRARQARNFEAKRLTSRLLLIGLLLVVLWLLYGYAFAPFKDASTSQISTSHTTSRKIVLDRNVPLVWPLFGQAALGSVEEGFLARSANNEKQRSTASMAKVITALAVMEKQPFKAGEPGQSYILTAEDVANYQMYVAEGGSVVQVHDGMVLTQYQALQMMLVASSNNIADTLAKKVFGSLEEYKSYAQAMVQRMGLSQTIVADASGFSSATVSTPSELVVVGIAALKNPVIAEIVAQPQAVIPSVGTIRNTNQLLGSGSVIGIKTGTTSEAGSCLLFAASYTTANGQKVTLVGVIMGDANTPSLFSNTERLLVSAKQSLKLVGAEFADDSGPPGVRPGE